MPDETLPPENPVQKPVLPPEAERALHEAAERRAASQDIGEAEAAPAKEYKGRKGPEPVRYGDWEVKGIASDF